MDKQGKVTKSEKLLLGLTTLFLCVLLVLFLQDRQAAELPGAAAAPERAGAQQIVVPERAPVGINTASEQQLAQLPGLGRTLACRIVEYREDNGPFETLEEIMEVPGIGAGKLSGLREYLVVD